MTTTINAKSTGIGGLDVTGDASGSLGLQTGGVTAVTIDTSQRVGIGTTSIQGKFNVGSGRSFFGANSETYSIGVGYTQARVASGQTYYIGATDSATPDLVFSNAAGTERMRIDSSGNVLVNCTSTTYGEKLSVQNSGASGNGALFYYTSTEDRGNILVRHARSSGATNGAMIQFLNSSGTAVGTINSTGSATSYGTSSDYRLKENIAPMTGALDTVSALKPVTYTWKTDGSDGQGFIAHELQAIVPDCVTGEKDAVDDEGNPKYQGVDTSFLVATLTAAIQEQQTIINDLKARIETLEGAKS